MALADSECNGLQNPEARLSCFVNKVFLLFHGFLLADAYL